MAFSYRLAFGGDGDSNRCGREAWQRMPEAYANPLVASIGAINICCFLLSAAFSCVRRRN